MSASPCLTNPFSYEMTKKKEAENRVHCRNREALFHFSLHSCHDHEIDNKKWTSQFKRKLKDEEKKTLKNLLIHFIYKHCFAFFYLRLQRYFYSFLWSLIRGQQKSYNIKEFK